jgi:cyanophycinase
MILHGRLTPRVLAVAVLTSGLSAPLGAERLVLFGGGGKPGAALARFVEWSGGAEATVLIVSWASSEPGPSADWIREELQPLGPRAIEVAPLPPLDAEGRARFLEQVARATGIFFGGGDQGRIMDVLLNDRPMLEAVRKRHGEGVVFGGTSAGTAVMSQRMITGNGDFTVIDAGQVETREGLGLIPGVIVDQHFVKRQRENRLFGLVLKHPDELGVGVDEGAALLVEDGRRAEVVDGQVVVVDGRTHPGALLVHVLPPGARFDLVRRQRE